ncbi:MAG: VOC family protein [Actinomycetota bacterium]
MARYKRDTNFVWTDLSTYDRPAALRFYKRLFGWKAYDLGRGDAGGDDPFGMSEVRYHVATIGPTAIAGIFDMPPFFAAIDMPSFWMSYLSVDHLDDVVERARAIEGAVVDVEPTPFGDGTMALIRDPLGAGFTVYEGPSIDGKGDGGRYGQMVWNELITESIVAVEPFYREVVGVDLVEVDGHGGARATIVNPSGVEIGAVQEVDESIRSDKVYWLPFFSVDTIAEFEKRLVAAGGRLLSTTDDPAGGTAMAYDVGGAAFAVAETGAAPGGGVGSWLMSFLGRG